MTREEPFLRIDVHGEQTTDKVGLQKVCLLFPNFSPSCCTRTCCNCLQMERQQEGRVGGKGRAAGGSRDVQKAWERIRLRSESRGGPGMGRGKTGIILGEIEAPGWGSGCYQLRFQQDAFEGGEEGLVHGEALEHCSCPLFGGPVPAIPSTEHLRGAPQAQSPLLPAREGNWEEETWRDGEANRNREALGEI